MKNSKPKKILLTLLAGAIVAGSFVGCGQGVSTSNDQKAASSASKDQTTTASGEKKKVVVWSNNRHDLEYMNQMVKEFNDTNTTGEQIDYVVQSGDNYENLITMASSSGQAPDVMAISGADGISLKSFVDAKIIQPITSMITDDFKKVNEVDNAKFEGLNVLGNDIYWVPTGMRSGGRLIYNKELFQKSGIQPPKTINELVADAKKITQDGGGKYYGVIFPGQSGPWGRWIEGCAEMSGVTIYDYKNGKYDFIGIKPFVQAVRQMFNDKSVFPGSATMQIDPVRTQFAAGNVGIHGNASQEVGVLTKQFPAKMDWGVADLPTLDGTVKGALTITPALGWMMSSSTKGPKAAWDIINYFGSEKVLKGYLEGGYSQPISTYMNKLIDKSKTGRLADFALKDYESVYPQKPEVTPEGKNYQDALWAACLSDGLDIDKTIADLNKSYNDALDKAVKMGKTKRLVIKDYDPLHPSKGTIQYLDQ